MSILLNIQGGTSLRMLGLEEEYKRRGVPSLSHESYSKDGTLLGAYGASVRKGEYISDIQIKLQNENENKNKYVNEMAEVNNYGDSETWNGIENKNEESVYQADDTANIDNINIKKLTQNSVLISGDECISTRTGSGNGETIDNEKNEGEVKKMRPIGKKSARRIEKAQSRHNVHISRQQLRDLLMSNIIPSRIHWNKQFLRYENRQGFVRIFFHDGTYLDSSLLVGADGIYSTVRKQLVPQSEEDLNSLSKGLNYLGLMVILGISPILLGSKATITEPPANDDTSFTENGVSTLPLISIETSTESTTTAKVIDSSHNQIVATKRKRDDDDNDGNNINVVDVRIKHVDVCDKMNEEQDATQVP